MSDGTFGGHSNGMRVRGSGQIRIPLERRKTSLSARLIGQRDKFVGVSIQRGLAGRADG